MDLCGMPDVINLHFIDYCNYKCRFCFVKKENNILSFSQVKLIVDKIDKYFKEKKLNGRINLAGGEPLLHPHINEIIDYIYSKNIDISLITNGSLLTKEFILNNKNKISMIGISVDSIDENINVKLGRCYKNKVLDFKYLIEICNFIKSNGIRLKINTCVCKVNLNTNIKELISCIKPDRFKILQINPINKFGMDNAISNAEFENYIKQYSDIDCVCESTNDINKSYLIIDSLGNITTDNLHIMKYNILEYEINEALDLIGFRFDRFKNRY